MKTTIVYALLLALTAWPAAHLYLVQRYDLSSWKLAGWGMYATPRFDGVGMEIFGRAHPEDAWTQLTSPSAPEQHAGVRFLERYRWLRRLARPRSLADAVLAARPPWRELRIVVFEPVLVRATGMVEERRTTFHVPSGRIDVSGAAP